MLHEEYDHVVNIFQTFDGLVVGLPILSDGQVGRVAVGSPDVDALVLGPGGDVLAIRAEGESNERYQAINLKHS